MRSILQQDDHYFETTRPISIVFPLIACEKISNSNRVPYLRVLFGNLDNLSAAISATETIYHSGSEEIQ